MHKPRPEAYTCQAYSSLFMTVKYPSAVVMETMVFVEHLSGGNQSWVCQT